MRSQGLSPARYPMKSFSPGFDIFVEVERKSLSKLSSQL
jgi:hypothetical protein